MGKKANLEDVADTQVPDEQLEEIDSLFNEDADDVSDNEPAAEPEKTEPEEIPGQPDPEKDAKAKPEEGGTEPKPETTPEGKPPGGKPADPKPGKAAEEDDPEYEVLSKDGVRKVKLSALRTTYQQHHALQARHEAVKPIFDLSKESGIPVDRMFEFLVLGIQTAHESSQRKTTPAPGFGTRKDGEYQGPFESQEQEEALKESDPILYRTTKALWDQNQALANQLVTVTGRLEQAARAPQPTAQTGEPSPERKRIDGLMEQMKGTHKPYFEAYPDRFEAFKNYLGSKFPSVPLSNVDEAFLTVALQTFDPAYYAAWHEEQVKAKMEKGRKIRRSTFGERDSVRGDASSSLSEQQEHMADLLDTY